MTRKRLAIIGNGMAASRLLDELLRRNATAALGITVFGEEPRGSYNRILLGLLGGGRTTSLKPQNWYAAVAFLVAGFALRMSIRSTCDGDGAPPPCVCSRPVAHR